MADGQQRGMNIDLTPYRVHFCFLSGQAAANFLPIVMYRPDAVVLFQSKEEKKKQSAEAMTEAIGKAFPDRDVAVEVIDIEDAWSYRENYDKVLEAARRYQQRGLPFIINFTGGTKVMTLAVRDAASACDAPMMYLVERDGQVFFFHGRDQLQCAVNEFFPGLEDYLIAYGCQVKIHEEKNSFTETTFQAMLKLFQEGDKYSDSITYMNELTHSRDLCVKRERELEGRQAKVVLLPLCRVFKSMGRLKLQDGGNTINMINHENRKYLGGAWFEEFVCYLLRHSPELQEYAPEITTGIRASKLGENEVDVAMMCGRRLFLLECKSGKVEPTDVASEYLPKLLSLRSWGGSKTGLVFVSTRKISGAVRAKAKAMGILVACCGEIPRLGKMIADELKKH